MDYIIAEDPQICNIGTAPTITNVDRGEVIDITLCRRATRGTPEGAKLSPPIWNMKGSKAVDKFPKEEKVDCTGFADDFNLLTIGSNPRILMIDMQWGLIKLEQWAKKNSLEFNVSKTKAMMFTRKHNYDPVPLYLNGERIEFVESFKYLGVIFDRKLKWKIHIKTQIKKAKNSLMIGKRMIGKKWGLGPKQAYWLYTEIVRPMLMYGSLVWIAGVKSAVVKKELIKVQRLACLMITRAMRSTPTAGIEAMLGLEPLEITAMESAIAASIRIKNHGGWKREEEDRLKDFSHAKIIDKIIEDNVELMQPQDKLKNTERDRSKFIVMIGDRKELNETKVRPMPHHRGRINCFTDGSKTEKGAGNAYKIYSHDFNKGESSYLGINNSIPSRSNRNNSSGDRNNKTRHKKQGN